MGLQSEQIFMLKVKGELRENQKSLVAIAECFRFNYYNYNILLSGMEME